MTSNDRSEARDIVDFRDSDVGHGGRGSKLCRDPEVRAAFRATYTAIENDRVVEAQRGGGLCAYQRLLLSQESTVRATACGGRILW